MILRITRTFPRKKYNGIGLGSYYLQKFSKEVNIIFTKKINSKYFSINKKNRLIEIQYNDLKFGKKNFFNFLFILISKIYGEFVYFFNIYFYLKKKRIQISKIHLHSINYIFSAIILKKIFNVPLYLNFGGSEYYRLKKYRLLNLIIKNVDIIFTVSKSIFNELKPKFIKKVVHTSNGIDKKVFNCKKNKRKKQLIAVGNLRWQKNYLKMIEAFNIFFKTNKDYKLIIVGDGEEKQKIKHTIQKFNLKKQIILAGYKSQKKISYMLNESEVFLMSSLSEGMPKSLMEALACGTPVVVSDVGDCGFIAKGCGIVVKNYNDKKTFAKAIKSMISDKKKYKKYKLNCLTNSKNFSWKTYCDKVFNYY